jgi:pimeloyl-ACP methyl ester carboxylesterase
MTSSSNRRRAAAALAAALLASVAALPLAHAETAACVSEKAAIPVVHYRTAKIDGVDVFYREAGPADAPTVLLLHGFPTSSHMFRNLIPALADRFHVIAPDYPGFGESAAPDHKTFAYTFGHYADIVDGLLTELGVKTYAIYLMDYGAPVGHRLALKHPERVTALIVQNGNAYEEGLKAFWDPIKAYWADGSDAHRAAIDVLVAPETTKFQYTDGVADITRIDPDNWGHDQPLLYPKFQAFFRERKPPTLIVWGKNDKIFPADGATPYLRDLPDAELHLLDTGHFALEDKLDEMVPLIRDFLCRKLVSK